MFGDQFSRVCFDFGVRRLFLGEQPELDLSAIRGAGEAEDRWLGPTAASGGHQ